MSPVSKFPIIWDPAKIGQIPSQNHRPVEVGNDLQGSYGPTPPLKPRYLEPIAQEGGWTVIVSYYTYQ